MKSKSIQNGVNAGITFAVIIIFLAMIGFTVTGSILVSKVFGHPTVAGKMPNIQYLVIFLGLLGVWCGWLAARPVDPHNDKFFSGLINSLIAGLTCGLIDALFAMIYNELLIWKVDPRAYLAMISPDSMKLFLFNQSAALAFVIHIVLITATSLLGGILAFAFRKANIFQKIAEWTRQNFSENVFVQNLWRKPYTMYVIYVIAAILLFFIPRMWGSYWNYIIGTVGIYVILGLGLNIIVGLAGQLVLGYVAFFAIGAYTVALLTAPQPHNLQWNFWIALVVGIILAAITGILLGLPILRLRGDYLAIVTLGFGEIIRIMLKSDLLTKFTAGPKGIRDVHGPTLLGKPFTSDIDFMYLIILAVLLIIFITNRLQNSRTGRAWIAIREDEVAARATGINTFQSKLLALAIGAAFAGLGGVLFASRNQFTGPEDHSLMVSINVLALVIVGGMGNIPGVILGSFALKGLPEMLRELDVYRLLVFGGLLVAMMILRPEGLLPGKRPSLEQNSGPLKTPKIQPEEKVPEADRQDGVQHASNP